MQSFLRLREDCCGAGRYTASLKPLSRPLIFRITILFSTLDQGIFGDSGWYHLLSFKPEVSKAGGLMQDWYMLNPPSLLKQCRSPAQPSTRPHDAQKTIKTKNTMVYMNRYPPEQRKPIRP